MSGIVWNLHTSHRHEVNPPKTVRFFVKSINLNHYFLQHLICSLTNFNFVTTYLSTCQKRSARPTWVLLGWGGAGDCWFRTLFWDSCWSFVWKTLLTGLNLILSRNPRIYIESADLNWKNWRIYIKLLIKHIDFIEIHTSIWAFNGETS